MNVHIDKPLSKIQSDIFQSSIKKINQKTDLKLSFEKQGVIYKNGTEIVKYKVGIKNYKESDDMKGNELKWNKTKTKEKSISEKEVDNWLDDFKSNYDVSDYQSEEIPMICLKNKNIDWPIYVDDKYRLIDTHNFPYTNNASETMIKIKEWNVSDEIEYDVWQVSVYTKSIEKVCLLSEQQLKQRGLI